MADQHWVKDLSEKREILILQASFETTPPERLFEFFVQPDLLAGWWPPEAQTDARLGGLYRLVWPSMKWKLAGVYTAFEPGKALGFTWKWEHEPETPIRHVTIRFDPEGNGCTITLSHGNYAADGSEQDERQSHLDGWTHFLGQLRDLLEQAS